MKDKPNIVTIVGARPQFIKAAVVSRALRESACLEEIIIHTGQHYDSEMSATFFEELEIPTPKYSLGVGSGGHGYQTGEMLKKIESVLEEEQPAVVIVYGDTNSTLAGALAAAKLHIPVAHVEAGLRSFNKRMPEEINRIMTDHLSTLLFCPTAAALNNLSKEGIRDGVIQTGDVMYDVAVRFGPAAEQRSGILKELGLVSRKYLLATVHRAENTDNRAALKNIITALNCLTYEMDVVLPLHPRTRKMIGHFGLESLLKPICCAEPLGFLDMLMLIRNARLVATDSGGIQKEAYFHRVPCITLRSQTEWVETVDTGWNRLAEVKSVPGILTSIYKGMEPGQRKEIADYGDGKASLQIVNTLDRYVRGLLLSPESDGRLEIAS